MDSAPKRRRQTSSQRAPSENPSSGIKRANIQKDDKGGRSRSKKREIELIEHVAPQIVERKLTEEKSGIETVKSGFNKLAIDEKNRVEIKVAKWQDKVDRAAIKVQRQKDRQKAID